MTPLADGRASGVGHGDAPPELPEGPAPDLVQRLAAGREIVPVWANLIGQVTWRLGPLGACDYVKHGAPHREFDLEGESARLEWVSRFVAAPRVLGHGVEPDGTVWMHTAGLPGRSAVDKTLELPAAPLVAELGRALRHFHDAVPVADCPFSWSVEQRLAHAPRPELVADLATRVPPAIDLVVAHGDTCSPNFLIDDAGRCSGYVDLGQLGVADRWADLTPALLSLSWNFPDIERQVFLDAYEIELDQPRYDFYSELWNQGG